MIGAMIPGSQLVTNASFARKSVSMEYTKHALYRFSPANLAVALDIISLLIFFGISMWHRSALVIRRTAYAHNTHYYAGITAEILGAHKIRMNLR